MHRNVQEKGHVSLGHTATATTHAHRPMRNKKRFFLYVLFFAVHLI